MDLHYSQTCVCLVRPLVGLNPLWIYTTLKPLIASVSPALSLNPLWIYTTLKLNDVTESEVEV